MTLTGSTALIVENKALRARIEQLEAALREIAGHAGMPVKPNANYLLVGKLTAIARAALGEKE